MKTWSRWTLWTAILVALSAQGMVHGFGGGYGGEFGGVDKPPEVETPIIVPGFALEQQRPEVMILRTSQADLDVAEIIEDLRVMSAVLGKSLRQSLGDEYVSGGGGPLDVLSAVYSWRRRSTAAFESMYVEGYGAIFLADVEFPLVEGEQTAEAQAEPGEVDRMWEETKREMQGIQAVPSSSAQMAHEYDGEKVEELKDTILKTFRHASNIRFLSADEKVVMVVRGTSKVARDMPAVSTFSVTGPGTSRRLVTLNTPSIAEAPGGMLTATVAKKDVDALAGQDMTPEEFASKVTILVY